MEVNTMATVKILTGLTAIGVGKAIKMKGLTNHTVDMRFKSLAATKISALSVIVQGSSTAEDSLTGVTTNPTLTIDSTAERFANAAFYYQINGTSYTIAADSAGNTFTLNHVIGDGASTLWGCINVYADAAGALSTKVPLATQVYTTAALAHAAADEIIRPSNLCYVGRILIQSDSSTWTANTDNMTDGSELTTATFLSETSSFRDLVTHAFSATEIIDQKAKFVLTDIGDDYIRLFVSALTGTGFIDAWIASRER